MCLFPRLQLNKKYIKNKKNGGVIPPLPIRNGKPDSRVLYVPIGCGNCIECRKQESRKWQIRLQEEIKHDKSGIFVTLSFNDKYLYELEEECRYEKVKTSIRKSIILPNGKVRNYYNYELKKLNPEPTGYDLDKAVYIKATRLFLERWRKEHGKSVKHWFINELGGTNTERLHIHGIIFTDKREDIHKIWKYGHVYLGDYVSAKTINYIVKYVHKQDSKHPNFKSKVNCSGGIGKGYIKSINAELNKYNGKDTRETYQFNNGTKVNLPIYYRNKIYTEEEREHLWLNKLDQNIRFVLGQKIDISKDDKKYMQLLQVAQEKNNRLRFGNNTINWEKRRYEREKRKLKSMERFAKFNSGGKKR